MGSGDRNHGDEWLTVDKLDLDNVDVVQDLDKENWENIPKEQFIEVYSKDVYEHIENRLLFLENIHKICVKDAEVTIITDHSLKNNWADNTHKSPGTSTGAIKNYFTGGEYNYYTDKKYKIIDRKLIFPDRKIVPESKLVEKIVNKNDYRQRFYEDLINLRNIPFLSKPSKIKWKLRVVK